MTLNDAFQLERMIDGGSPTSGCDQPAGVHGELQVAMSAVTAFSEKRWPDLFPLIEGLFATSQNTIAKAFALQLGVRACDILFEQTQRSTWVARWNEIPGSSTESWCRFHRSYHEAVGLFFAGHLREAEIRFELAYCEAADHGYTRGQMRSAFHLGLIAQEVGRLHHATEWYSKAKVFSIELGAANFTQRVLERLVVVGGHCQDEFGGLLLLLKDGHVSQARRQALERCRCRRRENRSRKSGDEYLGLALVVYAQQKVAAFARILRTIDDPIARERLFSAAEQIAPLSAEQAADADWLRRTHGIRRMQKSTGSRLTKIFGRTIEESASREIGGLLQGLADSNGLSKEAICRKIWNFDYDPVIHDPRIYKLVMRARRFMGRKDGILVADGLYKLNPLFFS